VIFLALRAFIGLNLSSPSFVDVLSIIVEARLILPQERTPPSDPIAIECDLPEAIAVGQFSPRRPTTLSGLLTQMT
jgi:hypothetical protein